MAPEDKSESTNKLRDARNTVTVADVYRIYSGFSERQRPGRGKASCACVVTRSQRARGQKGGRQRPTDI